MPEFEDFLETFKRDLTDLAKEFGEDVKEDLLEDGKAFAEKSRNDLERWMTQLAEGELSRKDLEWLVKSKKDVPEMEALKQKGLAKTKLDKYRSALLETVAGSAARVLK